MNMMEQTGMRTEPVNMMMNTEDSLINQILKLSMDIQSDMFKLFTKINKLNALNLELYQLRKYNTMQANMNTMNNSMNMNSMNTINSGMNTMMGNNMMNNSSDDMSTGMNNMSNMNNNMLDMNNNMNNYLNNYNNVINTMNMDLMNLMKTNQNNPNMGNSEFSQLANPLENIMSTTLYEPGISVIINKNGNKTTISCKLNEKISDIIEKYKKATSNKSSNLKFIFNAKKLNENFTVSESGLVGGSVIYIIN